MNVGIRRHLKAAIEDKYADLDTNLCTYPNDDEVCNEAYLNALESFKAGDAVTIFTPGIIYRNLIAFSYIIMKKYVTTIDDTHFEIALACIKRGLHVLVTKPAVLTLSDHIKLHNIAR